jgi:hypothetical protein
VGREIEQFLRSLTKGLSFNHTETGAEESTLRRWHREFQGKMQVWTGKLESLAYTYLGKRVHLLDIPLQPLPRLEQALARLPGLPSRWPLLVQALHWLSPSHPLCIH